jgi:hypothetical protein
LEVRVGNVETAGGGRQVFGAVAKAGTDITALIRRSLRIVGQADDSEVTAFTDRCPGLRSILADAGITKPPILDWFHIGDRPEPGGAMGPHGRGNLEFRMKWRVMLELVGPDGTLSFMRLAAGRQWPNMRRR